MDLLMRKVLEELGLVGCRNQRQVSRFPFRESGPELAFR